MTDVFLSYKREEQDVAELFVAKLRQEGFAVWWDDDITPEERWDTTTEKQISEAASVVVLWSPLSIESEWVNVEAHFGRDHRKLVPVKIGSCEPPLAFRLTQTIDLCGWQGDRNSRQWRKLLIWLADLRSTRQKSGQTGAAAANPFRDTVGQLASGEPIADGVFINDATPPGTLFRDAPEAPVMRVLPRGHFLMGGAPDDADRTHAEFPQKTITIGYPFAMGVFAVTGAEFASLSPLPPTSAPAAHPKGWFARKPPPPRENAPRRAPPDRAVNCVSWLDANVYCQALSARTAATYRLPSEAEWEYACRAGSPARFSWGSAIDSSRACFGLDRDAGPIAPGSFPANGFGLHDMHGNVREWTADLWHDSYEILPLDGRPVTQGHGSMRVTRGGAWSDSSAVLRSSARGRATESVRSEAIGFRVVRDLVEAKER